MAAGTGMEPGAGSDALPMGASATAAGVAEFEPGDAGAPG